MSSGSAETWYSQQGMVVKVRTPLVGINLWRKAMDKINTAEGMRLIGCLVCGIAIFILISMPPQSGTDFMVVNALLCIIIGFSLLMNANLMSLKQRISELESRLSGHTH